MQLSPPNFKSRIMWEWFRWNIANVWRKGARCALEWNVVGWRENLIWYWKLFEPMPTTKIVRETKNLLSNEIFTRLQTENFNSILWVNFFLLLDSRKQILRSKSEFHKFILWLDRRENFSFSHFDISSFWWDWLVYIKQLKYLFNLKFQVSTETGFQSRILEFLKSSTKPPKTQTLNFSRFIGSSELKFIESIFRLPDECEEKKVLNISFPFCEGFNLSWH